MADVEAQQPKAEASAEQDGPQQRQAQKIDPWTVQGEVVDGKLQEINYDSLIEQFGTKAISQELLDRFEALTGRKPHVFLRRGIFFSHR